MKHVVLDPLKLTKFHELKTMTELYIAKAKLELLKNKPEKGGLYLAVADSAFMHLDLFVMICEKAYFTSGEEKQ